MEAEIESGFCIFEYYPGQGASVVLEILLMACDRGCIRIGEKVIARAGKAAERIRLSLPRLRRLQG